MRFICWFKGHQWNFAKGKTWMYNGQKIGCSYYCTRCKRLRKFWGTSL